MYFHRYTPCRKLPLLGQFGLSLPGGVQQTPSPPHLLMNMNERVLFIFFFLFFNNYCMALLKSICKGQMCKKKKKVLPANKINFLQTGIQVNHSGMAKWEISGTDTSQH